MAGVMGERSDLFGTDGVRGVAGHYPLDHRTVRKLGCALGMVLGEACAARPLKVVVGEDTRESSPWISRTLAAGLSSSGAEVVYAGVITTPGVAFLTRHRRFAAGVMVSASHNPYQDNGIKVLSDSGMKLPESLELEVGRALEQIELPDRSGQETAELFLEPAPQLLNDYLEYLEKLAVQGIRSSKLRIVADCAHGAASRVVPPLLEKLGIEARVLHDKPDGRNINLRCGSLHPEAMASETRTCGADLGVAFDGDADRAIFSTSEGRIADGDHVLFAAAPFLEKGGELKGHAVVGTVMTNVGLELALAQHGIALKRTAVGDKYVLEEMLRSGINLGGEPSGHIIFSDLSLSGDGIITLLQVLRLLVETGKPFHQLVSGLKQFPQVIRNVRVKEKPPLESLPQVARAIEECRRDFGERGRVVVRYSGTEPLARVMVEGERAEAVERHVTKIAKAIESAVGAR
jgi:phosphoglucosamine mutase